MSMGQSRWRLGRLVLVGVLGISLLGNAVTAGALWRVKSLKTELVGETDRAAFYPPEIRRALRKAMQNNRADLEPVLKALVGARVAVIDVATAEPFDRVATEEAMAAFRAEIDEFVTLAQSMVLDVLEAEQADTN